MYSWWLISVLNKSYIFGYTIAGIITLFAITFENTVAINYIWIFLIRFGIEMSFTLSYYANSEYFKPKVRSISYSFWNLWARTLTIFSPLIAETIPKSLLIITGLTLISAITSQFLRD